jgi:threonine/homoserine/homoserine lactone efflux protein
MLFLAFLFAAVVLAVTPGPGIAYVVARTVAGGRSEGLASCFGTGIGGMLHVLAAALGLSSTWVFAYFCAKIRRSPSSQSLLRVRAVFCSRESLLRP